MLEAFGNTRTVMNANATRFSQVFSVDFDHSGVICSASVQVIERESERNPPIFTSHLARS